MPPKRKAAASRKAATPAARWQKTAEAAAADPTEETTAVEVPGSRKDRLAPFHEMYVSRELTDVVLVGAGAWRRTGWCWRRCRCGERRSSASRWRRARLSARR
jgi:hypothetical protein